MRIGIDGSALSKTQPTGVEIATRDLLWAIFRNNTDHQFILYTPTPLEGEWNNLPQVQIKQLPQGRLWTQTILGPQANRDRLDLFWSPSYMLPLTLKVAGLVTIHGVEFMKYPKSYSLKNWLLSYLTVNLAKLRAHHIIAVSKSIKLDLQKYWSIPERKISVIYNAVSPKLLHHLQLASKTPSSHPYILSVGRIEPRKNTVRLVQAFANIAHQFPDLQLYLVGFISDVAYGRILQDTIADFKLSDRVKILGHLSHPELASLYRNATLLAVVSLDEGFGIPVLEGFSAHIPVVTSKQSATAEVAGGSAVLVDAQDERSISDGLAQVLTSPDLVQSLIKSGDHQLTNFSWDRSAKKFLQLVTDI